MGLLEGIGDLFAGAPDGKGSSEPSDLAAPNQTGDATPAQNQEASGGAQTDYRLGSGVPDIMPHGAPAATEPANGAADAAPQGTAEAAVSEDRKAVLAHAVKQMKNRGGNTRAHAALLLGMTAPNSGEPIPDDALAAQFDTTVPVVAAQREAFQQRARVEDARNALGGTAVLPDMVVRNPQAAMCVQGQAHQAASMETMLSEWHPSVGERFMDGLRSFLHVPEREQARAMNAFAAQQAGVTMDEARNAVGGMSEVPEQFASKGAHSITFGVIPDVAGDAQTGLGQAGGRLGNLAGFIVGPVKLAGAGLGKLGTKWLERTAGDSYAKALAKDTARAAATLGTASALENAGDAIDSPDLATAADKVEQAGKSGAATGATFGAVSRLLPDATGMQLLGRFVANSVLTQAESGEAPFADIANWNELTAAQKADAVFDYALNGLFSARGAGKTQGGWLSDAPRAVVAEHDYQRLKRVSDQAADLKWPAGDPRSWEAFLGRITANVPDIYLPADKLEQAFRTAGMSQEEPALRPATEPAKDKTLDGHVRLSVHDFLTLPPGTRAELMQDVKTDSRAMSKRGADEFLQKHSDDLKEQSARLVEEKRSDEAWKQSQQAVHDDLLQKLQTTGKYSAEMNRAYAALHRDFFTVLAERLGIKPHEAYEQYGADVHGEEAGNTENAFLQDNGYRKLRMLMSEMREIHPEVFRSPKSEGKTIAEIFDDHLGENGWKELPDFRVMGHDDASYLQKGEAQRRDENPTYDGNKNKWYWIKGEKGPDGKETPAFIIQHLHDADELTHWLDISAAKPGSGGSRIYTALGDYANNARKVFDADPHGLNDNSRLRRTVNMMNIAVRHGTTRWINPGEQQKLDWKENLLGQNNEEADLHNFKVLVDSVIEQVETALPETKELYYDFERRGFYDSRTQERIPEDGFTATATDSRAARAAKIGAGTIRQAIILKSLLQAGHDRGRSLRILQALLNGNHLLHGAEGTFYQEVEGGHPPKPASREEPRGSYDPETRIIALLKSADASTFPHESAHLFLDIYSKIAAQHDAPAVIRQDMDALLRHFRVRDLDTWNRMSLDEQRPYHEQFARGFETYLMEGRAPTPELRPLFAQIKGWLLKIYQSLDAMGIKLNPEVRGVMDHMLASEAGERSAAQAEGPPIGHPLLDAEQWAKYQKELRAMSPENRAIVERFADKLRNYDAAVAEYAMLQDSQGGKVLNTDIARELSEDYLKDRTKSEVVQRLASAFVRKMYAEKLEAIDKPKVLFSAGGPGSGKSTAIASVPELVKKANVADIVYDTTMSHYASAKGMIEQALGAGGFVNVTLVIREPVDALVHGAIRRAKEEEKEYGSGRTVSVDYFIQAHQDAMSNVFRLADEYKGNSDIRFSFVDNSHGKENIREVSLEQARKIEFQEIEAKAKAALEKEYEDGKISEKIYTGFKHGASIPRGARKR